MKQIEKLLKEARGLSPYALNKILDFIQFLKEKKLKKDELNTQNTPGNDQHISSQEYFERWKHFESAGGNDKSRMITIVTWLLALGAAILGYIVKEDINIQCMSFSNSEEAMFLGLVGAFIAILGIIVVKMFSNYANQNWVIANNLENYIPDLQKMLNELKDRYKPKPSGGMAPIFKVFLGLSIGILVLFLLIILLPLISKILSVF